MHDSLALLRIEALEKGVRAGARGRGRARRGHGTGVRSSTRNSVHRPLNLPASTDSVTAAWPAWYPRGKLVHVFSQPSRPLWRFFYGYRPPVPVN
ncbi:hypothetical protein GFS60_04797 [Rhodococcus sp. WAY2]|nr:hypothetical protein GFS60_04797 [Rhodococcus sp. WAY2]